MKKTQKSNKDPEPEIYREGVYLIIVHIIFLVTLIFHVGFSIFANDAPNLRDIIFGLIRAAGLIKLCFGIVWVNMMMDSCSTSDRTTAFQLFFSGVVITFVGNILAF